MEKCVEKLFLVLIIFNVTSAIFFNKYHDDVLELIAKAGYKGEGYQVATEDGGWILRVHRILPVKKTLHAQPVFLMHGIFATSADYVITGRKNALAYLLADNGYDVYMGNSRGNRHAMVNYKNVNYKTLWNFSFNEIGMYDLPAMIDLALRINGASKLFFVGHSQGTTSVLALLATRPEYNDKIIQSHLFAPVSFMKYLPNTLIKDILQPTVNFFTKNNIKVFNLSNFLIIGSPISRVLCNETLNRHTTELCKAVIFTITGPNTYEEEIDTNILPQLVDHISWQVSAQQLLHYAQLYLSGKFQQFDYRLFNSSPYSMAPSQYNLSNIYAPMYIYRAPEDLLSSKRDIDHLVRELRNVQHYQTIPNYNHADFTYGRRSRKIFYYDVLNFMQSVQYNENSI